ncbi:DMT family transporter [Convivina intestini]|uniref:Small multidrug resistance pump n=1 Tax=Convivina intestini TaxID=1505726 RepID=A0A2U1D7N1_9LACO|nr:multidrug efflux SMR transporter [Convivina intestini]PVY83693.1 small multidrug resistance pump [Convivina intestini]CAH1853275.1 Quaternary ammonium compound-resistance protein QacC [Convivina intestini]CAH1855211.1 Quaternary ammonium compound-resistance protein QacC [Convivina intestini]SDB92108.1 small multidrug resistance pump [Leuconostocaceae bacterium R-53105]
MGYLLLALAIAGEIIATNLLKASAGFTRLWPSVGSMLTYGFCFYCFALSLKSVNLSIAYAVWAGLGIVITTLIAVFFWKEPINWPIIIGITLIVIGVVIVSWFEPS